MHVSYTNNGDSDMSNNGETRPIELDLTKEIAAVIRLVRMWRIELESGMETHSAKRATFAAEKLRKVADESPASPHSKIARRLDTAITLVCFQATIEGKIILLKVAEQRTTEAMYGQTNFDDLHPNNPG